MRATCIGTNCSLPEGLLHHPLFLQNGFSSGHQAIPICAQACTIVMADVTTMFEGLDQYSDACMRR